MRTAVQPRRRGSKAPNQHRSEDAIRYACEPLETRTLFNLVVAPHFGAQTQKQDGGARLTNPSIVLIFWGSFWGGANTAGAQMIKNATNSVCTSGFFQVTAQYGTGGTASLNPASAYIALDPAPGFSATDIDNIVNLAIAGGQVPNYPSNSAVYEVVTPPGIGSGVPNASGFNHKSASGHVDAWVPAGGTVAGGIYPDGYSFVTSHEIAEAMTDPGSGGIQFNPTQAWIETGKGGDGQIGDHEGNSYYYREPNGAVVQPVWSSADQAWVADDGNPESVNLDASWAGNVFLGKYNLTVYGDQLGAFYNDNITVGTFFGGVYVKLNGETTAFDPTLNPFSNVLVRAGGGNNTVNVSQVLHGSPVSVYGFGADTVTIGSSGSIQAIQDNVFVQDDTNLTALTIDDSSNAVARTMNLFANKLDPTNLPGLITWAQEDLSSLTIKGGAGGNTFMVAGTPSNSNSVTTTIQTGTGNDHVDVEQVNGPLTVNTQAGTDTVDVAATGKNLDTISGTLTVTGSATSTLNINDQLNPNNFVPTADTFSNAGLVRTAYVFNGLQVVPRNTSILNSGFGNVVLNTGAIVNTVNVEGDASPVTINAGVGTLVVYISQTAENLDNVPQTVTVNGTASTQLVINDQNNPNNIVNQDIFSSTGVSRFGERFIFIGSIPVLTPFAAGIGYSGVGGVTFNGGSQVTSYFVASTAAGIPLTLNEGPVSEPTTIGDTNSHSLLGIASPVSVNCAGGSNAMSLDDPGVSSPAIVHVNATQIGAASGDNIFGSGGSLTYSGFSSLTLTTPNASTGDTVIVKPSATTSMTMNEGSPTSAPGDRLNLDAAGTLNLQLTPNGTGAGTYTFSNRQPVAYTGVEQTTFDATAPFVTSANFHFETGPQYVAFAFSETLGNLPSPSNFFIQNQDTLAFLPQPGISYQPNINTAFVTFNSPLPDGNYLPSFTNNSGVTDLAGNLASSGALSPFFMLTADANHDRYVNSFDFTALAQNFNKSTTTDPAGVGYAQGDFNYDGNVNAIDFNLLATRFGTHLLPAVTAPALSSVNNPATSAPMDASGPAGLFSEKKIESAATSDVLNDAVN